MSNPAQANPVAQPAAPAQAAGATAEGAEAIKQEAAPEPEVLLCSQICKWLLERGYIDHKKTSYAYNVVCSRKVCDIMQNLRYLAGQRLGRKAVNEPKAMADANAKNIAKEFIDALDKDMAEGKIRLPERLWRDMENATLIVERRASDFITGIKALLYGDLHYPSESHLDDFADDKDPRCIGFLDRHVYLCRGSRNGPAENTCRISQIGTATVAALWWASRRNGIGSGTLLNELADRLKHLGVSREEIANISNNEHYGVFRVIGDLLLLLGERRSCEYTYPCNVAIRMMSEMKDFKKFQGGFTLAIPPSMVHADQIFTMACMQLQYATLEQVSFISGIENCVTRADAGFGEACIKAYEGKVAEAEEKMEGVFGPKYWLMMIDVPHSDVRQFSAKINPFLMRDLSSMMPTAGLLGKLNDSLKKVMAELRANQCIQTVYEWNKLKLTSNGQDCDFPLPCGNTFFGS